MVTSRIAGLLFLGMCLPAGAATKHPELARLEGLVIEGTNDFRAEHGLPPLVRNRELEDSARAYAALMARTGTLSHEADGTTVAARASRHGYDHCVIAENIARQYSSAGFTTSELARGLVDGWKRSPGHRKNMLGEEPVETGVAIAQRTYKGHPDYYAVQLFGRPASARIEFEIRNATSSTVRYRIGERPFALAPHYARTHTECAPRRLDFEAGADFTAGKGDRFVVTSTRGRVSVRRE